MAWVIANSGEPYNGETHVIAGTTYSGKTHTSYSLRLSYVDEPEPKPALAPKSAPKKAAPRKKAAK